MGNEFTSKVMTVTYAIYIVIDVIESLREDKHICVVGDSKHDRECTNSDTLFFLNHGRTHYIQIFLAVLHSIFHVQ